MKFYMAAGRLAGTQADAKDRDPKFVQHDVPTDKEGLMEYVNGLLDQIASLRHKQTIDEALGPVAQPEVSTPPPPPPAAPNTDAAASQKRQLAQALRGMEVEAIEERILDLKGPAFGRIMAASVERLGALGKDGCGETKLDETPLTAFEFREPAA